VQASRRTLLGAAGACALGLPSAVFAQQPPGWPTRPVRLVVPSPAGGSPDRVTRLVAERLAKKWNQSVLVENKAGATSMIGTEFVAKSPPDGYTLLSTFTSFVQVPALFKKIPYDTERDLVPVTQMVGVETVFLVRTESPWRTMQEFADSAKAAKPRLSYATFGSGSSFHIYGEKLAKALGFEMTHVPYKGEAQSTTDLLGGQVSSGFASIGTALPHIRAGKLRALAIVMPQRSKVLPDVPTMTEAGVQMPDVGGWFGVLAPAGTPAPVVQKVSADIAEVLRQPDVVAILREQGLEPVGSSPDQFATRIKGDLGRWKALLPEVGIQPGD
jgi:tripartite-type tricarboxylate transporter receptor subunit TctC